MKTALIGAAAMLVGTAGLWASQLAVQKLVVAPTSLQTQLGMDFRYTLDGKTAESGSGFLVFENLKSLPANSAWAGTEFTTYNTSASATGESGFGLLGVTIPEDSEGIVFSPIVGVMAIDQRLTPSTPVDGLPENAIAIPDAEFRKGRLLASDNGAQLGNIGYVATPSQKLAMSPFEFQVGGSSINIDSLEVRPRASEAVLDGVGFRDDDPKFRFVFSNLPTTLDGLPQAIDEEFLWWEASPLFQNDFRASQDAPNLPSTPGWIFEPNFPWVYFYSFQNGKWVYAWEGDPNSSPTGFYGYVENEKWLYFYFNEGRWYYDFDEASWFAW